MKKSKTIFGICVLILLGMILILIDSCVLALIIDLVWDIFLNNSGNFLHIFIGVFVFCLFVNIIIPIFLYFRNKNREL